MKLKEGFKKMFNLTHQAKKNENYLATLLEEVKESKLTRNFKTEEEKLKEKLIITKNSIGKELLKLLNTGKIRNGE